MTTEIQKDNKTYIHIAEAAKTLGIATETLKKKLQYYRKKNKEVDAIRLQRGQYIETKFLNKLYANKKS